MSDTDRDRDPGRGRNRLHAGSLTWDSIPGLQDHVLGCNSMPFPNKPIVSFYFVLLVK